jgi:hypothetical protein
MSPTVLEPTTTPIHDTVAELIAEVRSQGNIDCTEAEALKWLTRRHRKMCERSRCYRKTIVQTTVKEQVSYAIPAEVIQIREVLVFSPTGSAFVPYGTGRHTDIAQGALHYLWLTGLFLAVGGGVAGGDWNEAGESQLFLYPTPTETGAQIKVLAVCIPPDLKIGEDSTIKVPGTYLDALVNGAIATGLLRLEGRQDLATYHEQVFNEACSELLTETNRKHRGPGPAEIRVVGYNS